VQDAAGVRVAVDLGVDRVELCSALALGGVTPSIAMVEAAVAAAAGAVGVHVLVRPRPGGFRYTEDELAVTYADVDRALAAGAAGVVVGAQTAAGRLDGDFVAEVVGRSGARDVTVHRVVDVCADPVAAVEIAQASGATRVLTSGGAVTAPQGTVVLRRMVEAAGKGVQVMAGGGIGPDTVEQVLGTGVAAVHFSARRAVSTHGIPLGAQDDGTHDVTDPDLAAAVVARVRGTSASRAR
jgi:copper homeostasis protein